MPLLRPADPTTHPLTHLRQWRTGHHFPPDALWDTTSKRQRGAERLLGDGVGIFSRLWRAAGHGLTPHHVIVTPDWPSTLDFYLEAPAAARELLKTLFDSSPMYAKVCLSRQKCMHIHAVILLPDGYDTPPIAGCRVWINPISTARYFARLAHYISKPADERACRPRHVDRLRYTQRQLDRQLLDATEQLLAARRAHPGPRLPSRSWTANVPRLRASRFAWILLAALRWKASRTEFWGHLSQFLPCGGGNITSTARFPLNEPASTRRTGMWPRSRAPPAA